MLSPGMFWFKVRAANQGHPSWVSTMLRDKYFMQTFIIFFLQKRIFLFKVFLFKLKFLLPSCTITGCSLLMPVVSCVNILQKQVTDFQRGF